MTSIALHNKKGTWNAFSRGLFVTIVCPWILDPDISTKIYSSYFYIRPMEIKRGVSAPKKERVKSLAQLNPHLLPDGQLSGREWTRPETRLLLFWLCLCLIPTTTNLSFALFTWELGNGEVHFPFWLSSKSIFPNEDIPWINLKTKKLMFTDSRMRKEKRWIINHSPKSFFSQIQEILFDFKWGLSIFLILESKVLIHGSF